MNVKIVNFLLGKMCYFLAGFMALPVMVAVFYNDQGLRTLFASLCLTIVVGFLFCRAGKFDPYHDFITNREGMATVTFTWILLAGLAAVPYVLYGVLDPFGAYFESMSGLTTTGATALTDIEALPKSILFWRSLTHWIGGLGIIVIFIALLPQISGGAQHLFYAETTGFTNDKLVPKMKNTALVLFYIYVILTLTETVLLVFCGLSPYDALTHSFSSIATGGFSCYNDSVAHFKNAPVEMIIAVFMVLSGANFSLYYAMMRTGIKTFWKDDEFRGYLLLTFGITFLIMADICLVQGMSPWEGFRYSFFQVASFISTTGFVSYNYDLLPSFAKLCLCILYFTGACVGSTAGGIKVSRFVVLFKTIRVEMKRVLHHNMLYKVEYNNGILPVFLVASISRFFVIYIACLIILSLAVAATGVSPLEAIFGVATCISSIGPGFGPVGAVGNFNHIPAAGKAALSVAMLLGRLELFTVLVLLRKEFWHKTRTW